MKNLDTYIGEGLLTGSKTDISNPDMLDLLQIMYTDPSVDDFRRANDMMREILRMKYVSERTDSLRTFKDMYNKLGDNLWICASPGSPDDGFAIITKKFVVAWNFGFNTKTKYKVIVAKGEFMPGNDQHMKQIDLWVHVYKRIYNLGPISKRANKELVEWVENEVSDSKIITTSQ